MEPEHEERRVDRWLDRALAEYGSGEAPAGIEERTLARLREQPAPAALLPRWWPGLAAAAAVILAAVVLDRTRPDPPKLPAAAHDVGATATPAGPLAPPATPAADGHPISTVAVAAAGRSAGRRPSGPATGAEPVPRGDQFPSPAPLSEQEEALVRYVSEFPREAVVVARVQRELREQERLERESTPPEGESEDPPR